MNNFEIEDNELYFNGKLIENTSRISMGINNDGTPELIMVAKIDNMHINGVCTVKDGKADKGTARKQEKNMKKERIKKFITDDILNEMIDEILDEL